VKLATLLASARLQAPLDAGLAACEATGVTADSRAVRPGMVFFAMAGAKADGVVYAKAAVAAGAVAVVADRPIDGVPTVLADTGAGGTRAALAHAAAAMHPGQPKTTVAITGTSGKTSVSVFTRQIWQHLGIPAASLGTIGVVKPGGAVYGALTTPDPVKLHETLAGLAAEGIQHLAMEASSHGIDQHRLDGVKLAASAFLNLSRDHLDYHHTMRAYFEAKMALLTRLTPKAAPVVVAASGPWGDAARQTALAAGLSLVTVGGQGRDLAIMRARRAHAGQDLTIRAFGATHRLHLPLIGGFQATNALTAAALVMATGSDTAKTLGALPHLAGVPGRLETVGSVAGAPVLVDYAHKPEALESVLATLRPYATGRLISVFGCGGDRDAGKRPIMGKISAEHADITIVTDDNPRSEDPATIRRAILAAAPGAIEIGDRRKAIGEAVAMLKAGDVLVVAGKGHEEGQIVGGITLPFSDHQVARDAIRAQGGKVTG
jgi:UDP-N-acetylmuramyl-tripeptide synthetase